MERPTSASLFLRIALTIPVKMPDDGDQHRGEHQQHRRADAAENERQHRHAAARWIE